MDVITSTERDREIPKRRRLRGAAALGVLGIVAGVLVVSLTGPEVSELSEQGGVGIFAIDAVELQRSSESLEVALDAPTPAPGSYDYPSAQDAPKGVEHPRVVPGDPEVFTLWMIVFNHPERCRVAFTCTNVDITGDESNPSPPAEGAVYQLGGVVASADRIRVAASVEVGAESRRGATLNNPECAYVHIALAPHGKALEGDELEVQLTNPIGGLQHWWVSVFEDLPRDCT